MPISAVDLFCGAGGLTHGLVREGIDVVAGVDTDPACRYPYEHNNDGCTFLLRDVSDIRGAEVEAMYPGGHIKLLVGCAPCQPFSTYSQRYDPFRDRKKWSLLREFSRIVTEFLPDVVSMENVPRLTKHEVYGVFVGDLRELGYEVTEHQVYCPDYGIPQTRTRLVFFASRFGPVELIPPTHHRANYRTVRHAIGGLEAISAGETSSRDPFHKAKNLTARNLRRIRASRPGGSWRNWDQALVAACHRKKTCTTYTSVYGRMEWDKPAPTVTTQCCGFGNGRFGHPEQDRAISLREAALLQTFPRRYEFVPPGEEATFAGTARLIGNAVPVRLGRVVARSIVRHLEGTNG